MKRGLTALVIVAALALSGGGVIAQSNDDESCPPGYVCVTVDAYVYEIKRSDGDLVGFVNSLSTTTTETLSDTTTSVSGTAIWFGWDGNTYQVLNDDWAITPAQAKAAKLGSLLTPRLPAGSP